MDDILDLKQLILGYGMSELEATTFLSDIYGYINKGLSIEDQLAYDNIQKRIECYSALQEQIDTLNYDQLKWFVNPH